MSPDIQLSYSVPQSLSGFVFNIPRNDNQSLLPTSRGQKKPAKESHSAMLARSLPDSGKQLWAWMGGKY